MRAKHPSMQRLLRQIHAFMAIPADNPELLKARYHAFARQLPMMYFILVSSSWAVSATHMAIAPVWLTIGIPALLTLVCAIRMLHWWRSRNIDPTPDDALYALKRINYLAFGIAVGFTAWSFLLFPYGDAYTRSHLAFYLAITGIACIFSLTHLRSAALIVTVIVNGAFIFFFAATGQTTFIATAINIVLVSMGMLAILAVNYRDFAQMVNGQTEALKREAAQSRLLRMIDNMPVAVMTIDPGSLDITYVNETSRSLVRSIEHLLPLKADDLVGSSMDVFLPHPERQRRILADPANLPFHGRMNLGPEVLEVNVSAIVANDGSHLGSMLTWGLVTKEVEAENRIRQLALYDQLTGLSNRAAFREELTKTLTAPGTRAGVLYIDLDGFKLINDTRGHPVGDALLGQVAARLRTACDHPAMTVGRLGGDEFGVLIPHNDKKSASAFADRVIEILSAPYVLGYGHTFQIGASIGIALAPDHGENADTLLARADLALYAAKAAGKGKAHVFSPDMETRIQERVRLETRLRDALDTRNGLFVFYQPIVNIETDRVTAREALMRWHDPKKGWISPGEFIPVAEQSGLIDKLGAFVLEEACQDAARRRDGARVAVNISAAQLGKGTLVPAVMTALFRSGLPPNRLEIEVTETALLGMEACVIDDLHRLRNIGVHVALDDFGTGYSSLAHLRTFPFDKIKIDGSFVKEAIDRPESAAVVKAVADLGKRLGVAIVAEGVETEAQLDLVREEGCVEIQGYLYGRPAPSTRDAGKIEELNTIRRKTVPV